MSVTDDITATLRAQDHGHPPVVVIDMGGGKSQSGIWLELSPPLTCTHGGAPVIAEAAYD